MSPITFVTVGLTAGAALAAIPVIIHLIMRQTPKHVIFPALRLIKERQKQSRKRMRIRNWLLLIARMVLIALMALALARPRLYSQTTLGDREVETALGLVFDTSYSMQYQDKDKSRLQEAKEQALDILKRSHESSQVFVIDSAFPGVPAPSSPAAAAKLVEGLTLHHVNRKLNQAVGQAYKAVAGSDLPRHEVYVFTDLSRSAWDLGPGKTVEGLDVAKKVKEGIGTFLVRLSPKDLRDVAVASAEPEGDIATEDQPLTVKAKLRSTGPASTRLVKLYVDGTLRDQKEVAVPADGEVDVPPLSAHKLSPGLHQGEVRLGGAPDPLTFDDRRFFTLDVRPPLKVLILSDRPEDGLYVRQAIDPTDRPTGTPRPFHVTWLASKKFEDRPPDYLKDFAAVFLLNVRSLSDTAWNRLHLYLNGGGGLVVALGDLVDLQNYGEPMAAAILPATIEPPFPPGYHKTAFGDGDWNHPILSQFREELQKNLSGVPVYRRAALKVKEGARTVLEFQDKSPALVERSFPGPRAGHALLWATALSRRAEFDPSQSPQYWTDFPLDEFWSFWEIMNKSVPYLAGLDRIKLTYESGEDVRLPIDPSRRFTGFSVRAPESKDAYPLTAAQGNAWLPIESAAEPGPWTVTASAREGAPQTLGFSVNPARDEERLAPLDKAELDGLFPGKDAYRLVDDPKDIGVVVSEQRIGREIFPWLMALILLLVTAENYLANKFYKERPAAVAA